MYNFPQMAVKLLTDYKALIKKQFSAEEAKQKLAELQLNKRLPVKEHMLYLLLERAAQKAGQYASAGQSRLRYSGAVQLLQHMRRVLALYRLQDKKVIHATQLASRTMIDAIQLMGLSKNRLTTEVFARLEACADCIIEHGTAEQKRIFCQSLRSHVSRDPGYFLSLLNRFTEDNDEDNDEDEAEETCSRNQQVSTEDMVC